MNCDWSIHLRWIYLITWSFQDCVQLRKNIELKAVHVKTIFTVFFPYCAKSKFLWSIYHLCEKDSTIKTHEDLTLPHCMMQEYQAEKKYFTLLCPNNTSKQPMLVRIPSLVPFDTPFLLLSFLVRFAPLEEQAMDSYWFSQHLQLLCFQHLHLPHHCPTRKASYISGKKKQKQQNQI